jgi:spore germination cell wall hydrolase CwlJ-like protein
MAARVMSRAVVRGLAACAAMLAAAPALAAPKAPAEIDPAAMLLALRPSILAAEAQSPVEAAQPEQAAPAEVAQPKAVTRVEPYRLTADATGRHNEVECLAAAVHYEAANQGQDGMAAVAQVVLNRLMDPRYPKSVCGVVFQGSTRRTGCQFTFTCDGSLSRKPSLIAWKHAEEVAEQALDGYVMADVGSATHYHTVWVHPYWSPSLVKVATIGAHIFYRAPGSKAPGALGQNIVRVSAAKPVKSGAPAASQAAFTLWGLSPNAPAPERATTAW